MSAGILYLVGSFKSGGTETQLFELLRRLDRRRFEPSVLCIEKKGSLLPEVESLGVEVRDLGVSSILRPGSIKAFRRHAAWALERDVRIIHGFLFHGGLYGAALKARVPGASLVVSEQAIGGHEGRRHGLGRLLFASKVDVLTANCEAVRRFVAARYGTERDRIRVIYGGVDVRRFSPRRRSERGPGAPPVIGCVGRLHPDKGQTVLVSAASAILREFPSARFLLVGEGPQRGEIEALIARLGIQASVEMLGDRRDVPEILAGIDVAVLPSTSEGFANAALEGLACGIPLVVSDAGGNPEIVTDRITGRVFPNGDASALAACVVEMLRDPDRAREMSEEGRRRVETVFPLEEMVRRHEELYEDLLGGTCLGADDARVEAAG